MRVLACVVSAALVVAASPAVAGPVIREAVGANAAAIQGAVDAFRIDLGEPNNGTLPGSQPAGRREIGWDGGGAGATPTVTPSPMTNFANRGASFFTTGVGLEISGAPLPEFGEINPTYPALFAPFSSPRIFTALNSNVIDVVFHVPGNLAIPGASTGFGAVFTDVDSPSSTKMELYAPDGSLLYERFVPYLAGSESLSFLGVSFNAGEVVARVRIISGNAALGPDESGSLDLVVMDDFIYGEPVATLGLSITPSSTPLFSTANFDLVVGIGSLQASVVGGRVKLDGIDVTQAFLSCMTPGTITGVGGQTLRCPVTAGLLPPGEHVVQVEIDLSDQTRIRNAVRWTVAPNTEP